LDYSVQFECDWWICELKYFPVAHKVKKPTKCSEAIRMRLLWARALDDYRTAIVIDSGGGYLMGGVVVLVDFDFTMPFIATSPSGFNGSLSMNFRWEWWRSVSSPEDFEQSREWERGKVAAPVPMIEDRSE
jgi:hypothetical protein